VTSSAAPAAPPTSNDHSYFTLAGVVLAYAVLNFFILLIWPDNAWDVAEAVVFGGMVFQPISFGLWTALGAGSILTRLPLSVPCLMFLFVVPGYVPDNYADTQQRDFIATVAAGFVMYAATVILFLIFRRFTGFRIERPRPESPHGASGVKFGIKYLFALLTIFAVVLGLATQLKLQTTPTPPNFFFGPNFYIEILAIIGSAIYTAVLPTLVVPLSILHGRLTRSALLWSLAIWLVFMTSLVVILFDSGDVLEAIGFMLLAQLGAVMLGAATAFPLRVFGLRLIRRDRRAAIPHGNK
jgi:hypothetical protein